MKSREIKSSQQMLEIQSIAKKNKKKIFEQLLDWKRQNQSKGLFGKKKKFDANNIKSHSTEKYSNIELRFLCQKYIRICHDMQLYELGKIRFNRELVHSNMTEEEAVLYHNLFNISQDLSQRKHSLINEQKLKNMIFSGEGLKCEFTHELIIKNSEYNEVAHNDFASKKKPIPAFQTHASDGSTADKVNMRSVVWQILTRLDDIKERCLNKYKEKLEEHITKELQKSKEQTERN